MRQNILDRIESRILIGVTAYIGIMILVGWVAINENARMESFEQQFQARAIERGAALYALNCSTCHGAEGRGLEGRAPGLNNPQFFGYDYIGPIEAEMEAVQARWVALTTEQADVEAQMQGLDSESEEYAELQTRLEGIISELTELNISERYPALQAERDNMVLQLQTATKGYPIYMDVDADGNQFLVAEYTRLDQINWAGTLYDFIFTTLIHGRPPSISYWSGNQMVAWSQRAGGPLRDDQLGDLTEYILNWDRGSDWTLEDALAVNQYAIEPSLGGGGVSLEPPAGIDITAILTRLEEQGIVGDPVRGQSLYTGTESSGRGALLGCSGCHFSGAAAPNTVGTWDRVANERLALPQFSGYTVEQYVIESIVRSGEFIVEGYQAGVMPGDFGSKMSLQDLADIMAYLSSQ